ncbi:hypothetical protein FQZ97_852080 [compost metagenome]
MAPAHAQVRHGVRVLDGGQQRVAGGAEGLAIDGHCAVGGLGLQRSGRTGERGARNQAEGAKKRAEVGEHAVAAQFEVTLVGDLVFGVGVGRRQLRQFATQTESRSHRQVEAQAEATGAGHAIYTDALCHRRTR